MTGMMERRAIHDRASAELSVLLRLIEQRAAPARQAAAPVAVPARADWGRLEALADRHGLYPQLAEAALSGGLTGCPPDMLQSLQVGRRMRQLVNVVLERQLVEILSELRIAGLPAAALKGPVLDWHFYAGTRLRQYADIDVWVAPHYVAQARRRLKALGFSTEVDVRDPPRHPALRAAGEMIFTRRGSPDVDLDLHWRLFASWDRDCPQLAGFEERLQDVMIASNAVPTLGNEDLLIFLCHHAAKHGVGKLAHVQEIGLQLARVGAAACERLYETAHREGRGFAFAIAPFLASRIAETEVPRVVDEAVRNFPGRDQLLARIVAYWEDVDPQADGERMLRRLLVPTRSARIHAIASDIAIPRLADWRALPLDGPLAEIYYVLRPLRLLARALADRAGIRSHR